MVDDGARNAIAADGRSLLSPGIRSVIGEFEAGDVVSILGMDRVEFARGLVRVPSSMLPSSVKTEVIHRNNLVVL